MQWTDGWVFEGEFKDGKPHRGNLQSPGLLLDTAVGIQNHDKSYSLGISPTAHNNTSVPRAAIEETGYAPIPTEFINDVE